MLDQLARILGAFEELPEAHAVDAVLIEPARMRIEAVDVVEHLPEPAADQIALLPEHPERVAGILDAAIVDRRPERHVGGVVRHPEVFQQRDEVGVGPAVEDDEPGIDGDPALRALDIHRVGVAARPAVLFVEGHVVAAAEQPGRRQAGHAGANDRNAAS